jgi:hypothetical protein
MTIVNEKSLIPLEIEHVKLWFVIGHYKLVYSSWHFSVWLEFRLLSFLKSKIAVTLSKQWTVKPVSMLSKQWTVKPISMLSKQRTVKPVIMLSKQWTLNG